MTDLNRRARPARASGNPEELWAALSSCPSLSEESTARDALWLTVWSVVCTRGSRSVTPMGSSGEVTVTAETVTDELLAAMEWLHRREEQARGLPPHSLFATMRCVATRSRRGSGRMAQADALHGMTNVSAGSRIRWVSLDSAEGAA